MPKKVTLEDGSEIEVFTQDDIDAEVDGLKTSQQKAMDEAKAAKRDLAKLKKQWDGLDPADVKALVEEKAEAERKAAEAEGDWEAREKQLTASHAKEKGVLETKLAKLESSLRGALVTAKLTSAIAEKKGDTALLIPHAESYVSVRETDDGFEAFVVDGDGTQRLDGDGNPMSFGKLVETELVPKFPRAFEGTGSSGSGASKSAGGAGGDQKTIPDGDNSAFLANLDGIASGEVAVR